MKDQLPQQPYNSETNIINLDSSRGPGTHWVAYSIGLRATVYFDSYGLAPPKDFMRYVQQVKIPCWYSTLPTQLNDSSICGIEVLIVLDYISSSGKPPNRVANEDTSNRFLERSN